MGKNTDLLLGRIRQHDEIALAELLERFRDPIRRIARRLLGRALRPHLDSMDLVQYVNEIILILIRKNKVHIDEHNQLILLANTLLRRKVAHYWRKVQRDPSMGQNINLDSADLVASEEVNPADAFAFFEEVEKLFRDLDPLDRRLLELRLEGYTTADAASELGVDAGKLRVRLARLRKRLRDRGFSEENPIIP